MKKLSTIERFLYIPSGNIKLVFNNLKSEIPSLTEGFTFFTEDQVNYPCCTRLENKILHKFYFEGMSHKEIARALSGNRSKAKINQSAVKHRLSRIRAKIRNFFYKLPKLKRIKFNVFYISQNLTRVFGIL